MENSENNVQHLYTKGNFDDIIRRTENVHVLTMFCPMSDVGMEVLYEFVNENLSEYLDESQIGVFNKIPLLDMFLCFTNVLDFCKKKNISFDNLYSFWGIIQSFKNLHYLNIVFDFDLDDKRLLEAYEYMRGLDKTHSVEMIKRIYKVDEIEIILTNLFTQNVIDMLNKSFILNDIISNSCLEREYLIVFEYDEYVNYMDMFCSNLASELHQLDSNIPDYLLLFPKVISEAKPLVRLITKYPN